MAREGKVFQKNAPDQRNKKKGKKGPAKTEGLVQRKRQKQMAKRNK